MIRVAIIGAAGRMGRALVRAVHCDGDVQLAAAVVSATSAQLGRDAGEVAGVGRLDVRLRTDLAAALEAADVAIDFSQPAATAANLAACRAARKPLVLGTTGFDAALETDLRAAAADIALLVAPNTSLAMTLLIELVRTSARALPAGFDIEIIEAHHRAKKDAPSGTALALGRAAAEGRGVSLEEHAVLGRSGHTPRQDGEIGFAVVRGGDIVGEHVVLFAGAGEQLTLGHRASDRGLFATGALLAARWLVRRPPGRYAMRDVIGLKTTT